MASKRLLFAVPVPLVQFRPVDTKPLGELGDVLAFPVGLLLVLVFQHLHLHAPQAVPTFVLKFLEADYQRSAVCGHGDFVW